MNISIKECCGKNNLNKDQFFYHKRRINNKEHKEPVFQAIQLNNNEDIINEKLLLGIKIFIGAVKIVITVSETDLINSIIKDLILNV